MICALYIAHTILFDRNSERLYGYLYYCKRAIMIRVEIGKVTLGTESHEHQSFGVILSLFYEDGMYYVEETQMSGEGELNIEPTFCSEKRRESSAWDVFDDRLRFIVQHRDELYPLDEINKLYIRFESLYDCNICLGDIEDNDSHRRVRGKVIILYKSYDKFFVETYRIQDDGRRRFEPDDTSEGDFASALSMFENKINDILNMNIQATMSYDSIPA